MTIREHVRAYDAPPLAEAVFELFTDATTDPRVEVFEAVGSTLTELQPWAPTVVEVQILNGQLRSNLHASKPGTGQRRWNKERNRAVLVGPGVVAYNVRPPYGN